MEKGLEMQMVMSQHFITLKRMVMIYFYCDIMDLLKAAETHKVHLKEVQYFKLHFRQV